MYLNKGQAEAMALLEADFSTQQKELYAIFTTHADQIEQDQRERMRENQTCHDHAIKIIQQSLTPSTAKTWSEYQAAEAKNKAKKEVVELQNSQRISSIQARYLCEKKDNEQRYNHQVEKLQQQFDERRRDISYQHTPDFSMHGEQLKAAKKAYDEALVRARETYNRSEQDARLLLKDKLKKAHVEAVQARHVSEIKFQRDSDELRKKSYEIVAQRLGLDGVTPDITSYVGAKTPYQYDSVQPLLGDTDLKFALREAINNPEKSDLIKLFHDVCSDDPEVDVVLRKAVRSLDLASLDEFPSSLNSTPGFKAHVIKTLAESNRSLKLSAKMKELKLTKRHISYSFDTPFYIFDDTPFHQKITAFRVEASEIHARYYAQCNVLEKQFADTIYEAKVAQYTMHNEAQKIYDLVLNEIEDELAWKSLATELSVYVKAFDYMVSSDEEAAKPVSHAKFNAEPFSLFSICEDEQGSERSDSMDDEDREVDAIMGDERHSGMTIY